MAIGGMIGGGIFSVLGVTIDLAGHLAFAAFLIGGAIAALTAHAYVRLALHSGRAGGPFTYLREESHERAAAWVAWLLVVGYVFALAVYAFTFGHYLAHALGGSALLARAAGVGVLLAFVAINLRGVSASGLTEDIVVFTKLAVLGGIALVGLGEFSSARLAPLDNEGLLGVFLGAAVIFVAYEGFELVPYDYDDLDQPRRTLPRALYISVAVVVFVYVAVTLASQMLVPDTTIAAEKEVAFAVVGQKALGDFGLWAAAVGAVFSTSSAINATLFSTARLVRDVSQAGELPRGLGRERHDVPAAAIVWIALSGAVFSLLPGITEIVSFGSLTFLLVFGLINLLHGRHTARPGWDRGLAYCGALACLLAAGGLLYYLARFDLAGLALIVVCAVLLVARPRRLRAQPEGGARLTGNAFRPARPIRGMEIEEALTQPQSELSRRLSLVAAREHGVGARAAALDRHRPRAVRGLLPRARRGPAALRRPPDRRPRAGRRPDRGDLPRRDRLGPPLPAGTCGAQDVALRDRPRARRRRPAPRQAASAPAMSGCAAAPCSTPEDAARIDARIDAAAQSRRLYEAMDCLPEAERAVLELVAIDELIGHRGGGRGRRALGHRPRAPAPSAAQAARRARGSDSPTDARKGGQIVNEEQEPRTDFEQQAARPAEGGRRRARRGRRGRETAEAAGRHALLAPPRPAPGARRRRRPRRRSRSR